MLYITTDFEVAPLKVCVYNIYVRVYSHIKKTNTNI